MSYERKEYYKLKNDLELKIYSKTDTQAQILETLGLKESAQQDMNNNKLTFKHSVINKKVRNSINIEDSIHAKSI